ncbi:MAG: PAS domain-containing protein [Planctomycetia bacterium]|nr:PAS domain-containing protein [Planctomycetia bacterium]
MATILIVDDCAENRNHFAAPLRHEGHRLLEATDSAHALALARSERPHLIIADTQVPKMDGYEIVHRLKADRDLAQTRIILYTDCDFQREAIALTHAVDVPVVLPKPTKSEDVVRMVDLALNPIKGFAESVTATRRRLDHRHSRLTPISSRRGAMQLERLTSENERLKAELRRRAEELDREVARREPAEQTLTETQERNSLALSETNDLRFQALFTKLMRDITERKRAERQLRDSEERFRQMAEHIGDVFWIYDSTLSRVSYVSPAYEKIWGRTRESLLISPQSWTEAIHPDDRDRVIEAAGKIYTHATYDETYRIVRPDGSIRWIRSRAFPVYDMAGKVIRLAGIAEDITDSKQTEEELRHYAQRLETASEIDRAILAARSAQEIAQAVASRIRRLVPCQRASVVTFDFAAGQALLLAVSVDGESHLSCGECVPIDAFGDMRDLRSGRARIAQDFLALSDRPPAVQAILKEGIRSGIVSPILLQNGLIGSLNLGHEQPGAFSQEHVEMAREIADRVAVALQDARLFEQVRNGQERLRALSGQLMKAQEDERRRISRELHDEVGQALTVTKVSLQSLTQAAADLAAAAQLTTTTVEHVVQQVRNLSHDLRPPMLDDLGLVAALRSHLDRQAQVAGFSIHFELEPIASGVSPEIETACFRVAQEAMTNIVRHARAHHVRIGLRQCETDLQLLIHDDGVGFDVAAARQRAARGESLGLLGMDERVAILGGEIDIKSVRDHGTEVRARFPMHPAS